MGIIIIAEAGVNHNGSLETAKKMIEAAAEAGADYIKFQTFIPENLVSEMAQKADYQRETTGEEGTQLDMLRGLALTFGEFKELQEYSRKKEIGFLSTPFDMESMEFLEGMSLDFWKLPSGEITNFPYLEKIGRTGKPVVMSTGMCTLEEVEQAYGVLKQAGSRDITILQCNTEYPTPYSDVNLRAMETMKETFGVPVGYSDHTQGTAVSIAAAALGAAVIEKHFTLSREMKGPDHAASLEPGELREMIEGIRQVEAALGDGRKEPSPSEKKNIMAARKSIVAAREIHAGEKYTENNLTVKRPAGGISPMKWRELLGGTAKRDYRKDEWIEGMR